MNTTAPSQTEVIADNAILAIEFASAQAEAAQVVTTRRQLATRIVLRRPIK